VATRLDPINSEFRLRVFNHPRIFDGTCFSDGSGMNEVERRALWRHWCAYGGDFPAECWDMRCAATTRVGTPCKRRDLYRSGRCILHGGLSTGP
jgi:hypothetical protein